MRNSFKAVAIALPPLMTFLAGCGENRSAPHPPPAEAAAADPDKVLNDLKHWSAAPLTLEDIKTAFEMLPVNTISRNHGEDCCGHKLYDTYRHEAASWIFMDRNYAPLSDEKVLLLLEATALEHPHLYETLAEEVLHDAARNGKASLLHSLPRGEDGFYRPPVLDEDGLYHLMFSLLYEARDSETFQAICEALPVDARVKRSVAFSPFVNAERMADLFKDPALTSEDAEEILTQYSTSLWVPYDDRQFDKDRQIVSTLLRVRRIPSWVRDEAALNAADEGCFGVLQGILDHYKPPPAVLGDLRRILGDRERWHNMHRPDPRAQGILRWLPGGATDPADVETPHPQM
jgi:hypothetical protein